MMEKNERQEAEIMRDRLKKILPVLKCAYENAKGLEYEYDWDIDSHEICEAYMTLADAYIGVIKSLEEEDEGGAK